VRERLRATVRVVFVSFVALGLAITVLGPITGDRVRLPLVAAVTVAGAAIAYEVFRAARKSGRLSWQEGSALWSARPTAEEPPELLAEWLLASARAGRGRSRQRFIRRLGPLAGPATMPLLDAMATVDAEEFDRLVARFVEESRRG
jgi:hypothetical protein